MSAHTTCSRAKATICTAKCPSASARRRSAAKSRFRRWTVMRRSRFLRKPSQEKRSGCAAKASRACAASPLAICSATSWWKHRSISPRGKRNCCTNSRRSTSTAAAATIRAPRAGWTRCANSSNRRRDVIPNNKGLPRAPLLFLHRLDRIVCGAGLPRPDLRGTTLHHIPECHQRTAQRLPRLCLVRFLTRPQARRRRHLRPFAVRLKRGHLQKQRLVALHPHPERIRIRLDAGCCGQSIDPLDRYRKESGLRPVAPEESGNADQIAMAIEQAATGGALAKCRRGLDHAAVAVRVERGDAAGRNTATSAAAESDRDDFVSDFERMRCRSLRARCGQCNGMQDAQIGDGIAGSTLHFGAQRSFHDDYPAGTGNDMAVGHDASIGKHDAGPEGDGVGVWNPRDNPDDAGGYFAVGGIVDCDCRERQATQQYGKLKTFAHFGYLP